MATIQLSDSLLEIAQAAAKTTHRTPPKWALLGKAVEESQAVSAVKMDKFEHIIGRYSETFEILSK